MSTTEVAGQTGSENAAIRPFQVGFLSTLGYTSFFDDDDLESSPDFRKASLSTKGSIGKFCARIFALDIVDVDFF